MAENTIPHPETQDERRARLDLEHRALASDAPDALANKLRELLSLGLYTAGGENPIPIQDAVIRATSALVRATAVALSNGQPDDDPMDHVTTTTFDVDDAVTALGAIGAILESSHYLVGSLEIAERKREGASNG